MKPYVRLPKTTEANGPIAVASTGARCYRRDSSWYNCKSILLSNNCLGKKSIGAHRACRKKPPQKLVAGAANHIISIPAPGNVFKQPLQSTMLSSTAIGTGVGLLLLFIGLKKILGIFKAPCDLNLWSKRNPPADYFRGKVVWVVGASQGIGKSLAVRWAISGARLILSSRNRDALLRVKNELLSEHGIRDDDVFILPLDITDNFINIEKAAQSAFQQFNKVDYIVYNVGSSQHAPIEDTSHHVAEKLIQMNLVGQIAVARAVLPLLLTQGHGHHVVIASMAANVPSPGQAVYAATKSALKSYFLTMATELHSRGIDVSVICPGPVDLGEGTQPRKVFGKHGLIEQKNTSKTSKRVSIDMFTKLALRAVYNKVEECWISKHPVLLMGYVMQFFPKLGMSILKKIGPGRVRQFDKGTGTGYDVMKMLHGDASVVNDHS